MTKQNSLEVKKYITGLCSLSSGAANCAAEMLIFFLSERRLYKYKPIVTVRLNYANIHRIFGHLKSIDKNSVQSSTRYLKYADWCVERDVCRLFITRRAVVDPHNGEAKRRRKKRTKLRVESTRRIKFWDAWSRAIRESKVGIIKYSHIDVDFRNVANFFYWEVLITRSFVFYGL